MNKSRGFTLIELLLVVVLLGIIASVVSPAIFNMSGKQKTQAMLIMNTSQSVLSAWRQIVVDSGASRDPLSSVFFHHSSHTALDVVVSGSIAVSNTFDTWYNDFGPSRLSSVIVNTDPTISATGVYAIDSDITFSISNYVDSTRTIVFTFQNVQTDIVKNLVDEYDNTSAFNEASTDSGGIIQYAAASNGTHTVTLSLSI
jgi:prepilin-type N-terminal cleavage/methylation domain-containing protein